MYISAECAERFFDSGSNLRRMEQIRIIFAITPPKELQISPAGTRTYALPLTPTQNESTKELPLR